MSRDESSGASVVGRALEEVFRTTSVIGGGWDSDLAVEPSPNALGNVLHFDYDHIGCCSKVKRSEINPYVYIMHFVNLNLVKLAYGSLVLGSSQFLMLHQMLPKMMLTSKVVKSNLFCKI